MNPDYRLMTRLRSQPRAMETLKRNIEKDRKELQRIRNDLLYETQRINVLMRRERTLVARIEKRTEILNEMRIENLELRQKMAEVLA